MGLFDNQTSISRSLLHKKQHYRNSGREPVAELEDVLGFSGEISRLPAETPTGAAASEDVSLYESMRGAGPCGFLALSTSRHGGILKPSQRIARLPLPKVTKCAVSALRTEDQRHPRLRYPRATSKTIMSTKPKATPIVPMLVWRPCWVWGMSSSVTTYIMAPAAKAST